MADKKYSVFCVVIHYLITLFQLFYLFIKSFLFLLQVAHGIFRGFLYDELLYHKRQVGDGGFLFGDCAILFCLLQLFPLL